MSFKPYVPAEQETAEFTIKSVLAGIVFGILFGCANAYLGLRVGLTISTSIPIAVVALFLFKAFKRVLGQSAILEYNMTQTVGSASSSLASGVIFTIPALFLWGLNPSLLQISMLACLGGFLGILIMIPLRPFLIVREHDNLPYPEGTACAEVLKASEARGGQARYVFYGLTLGFLYKFVLGYLKLWTSKVKFSLPFLNKAQMSVETTPALLAIGYILGFRIATIGFLGSAVSWLVIIPVLATYGDTTLSGFLPDWGNTLSTMTEKQIWHHYIRYVGAGAVTFAGIVTLVESIPAMYRSFRIGIRALFHKEQGTPTTAIRTQDDLSMKYVLIGVLAVVAIITFTPHVVGTTTSLPFRFLAAVCIAIFAFVFVTVSSRIVGMVGVSSNPTSGMTIVTLLGTSFVFYLLGMTDLSGQAAALTIGTVVCVAASIAGDTSQDLKTGYILGATPRRQQVGELIGVVSAAFFVAAAVYVLGKAYGFGSAEIPAPQALLMKTVIEAVLTAQLPWSLLLVGAVCAAIVHFVFRAPSLAFAVGMYIPIATWASIFCGGLVRKIIERRRSQNKAKDEPKDEMDSGTLLSSGLIAGEGIMGVIIAGIAFITLKKAAGIDLGLPEFVSQAISGFVYLALAIYLYRAAKIRGEKA